MASCKALVWAVCFIFLVELVSSHFITQEALKVNNMTEPHGRSMLQRQRRGHHKRQRPTIPGLAVCKVNFDNVNYKPLRRECKSPYRSGNCCPAFKRVACPYTDEINDMGSTCAYDMFGNINRFFPAGWFYRNCVEGPNGLDCLAA